MTGGERVTTKKTLALKQQAVIRTFVEVLNPTAFGLPAGVSADHPIKTTKTETSMNMVKKNIITRRKTCVSSVQDMTRISARY
jgi:hypothetical protein